MALNQITDGIWLGSLLALSGKRTLHENRVTHVLSVLDIGSTGNVERDFCEKVSAEFKHLYINIQDTEEEDLMQHFERTNEFIDGALGSGGAVLVHCIAGISRSATCVCAWLMSRKKITAAEAIEWVQSRRPVAHPNDGFREQLDVYYKCGFRVNPDIKAYREWKLRQQARELEFSSVRSLPTMYIPVQLPPMTVIWWHILPFLCESRTEAAHVDKVWVGESAHAVSEPILATLEPGKPIKIETRSRTFEASEDEVRRLIQRTSHKVVVLRCKGCSFTLATSASFVFHDKGGSGDCQHWFVEPIEWMRPELERGELEGRLTCPKCEYKLGSYLWQGSRCSCGTWVTPAIKFQKSRVDDMVVQQKPAL